MLRRSRHHWSSKAGCAPDVVFAAAGAPGSYPPVFSAVARVAPLATIVAHASIDPRAGCSVLSIPPVLVLLFCYLDGYQYIFKFVGVKMISDVYLMPLLF